MRISDWSSDVLLFRSVARGELLGGHALDVADEPGAVVGQRDRHRVYVEVDGVGPSLGATQQSQGVATHGGDRPDGDHAATTGARKSVGSGTSGSVRVELGGLRSIKKKKKETKNI